MWTIQGETDPKLREEMRRKVTQRMMAGPERPEHEGLGDAQEEFGKLLEQSQRLVGIQLDKLASVLGKLWQRRIDLENNSTGAVPEFKEKALEQYNALVSALDPLRSAVSLMKDYMTNPVHAVTQYDAPLAVIFEDLKSLRTFLEQVDQPVSMRPDGTRQAPGVYDSRAAKEASREWKQRMKGKESGMPEWLAVSWRGEKPMEQYTSPTQLLQRIQMLIWKTFELPIPQLRKKLGSSHTGWQELRKAGPKREKEALENFKRQEAAFKIPENVQRVQEVFKAKGLKWLIDPQVPFVAPPRESEESRQQYMYRHQDPRKVPKSRL